MPPKTNAIKRRPYRNYKKRYYPKKNVMSVAAVTAIVKRELHLNTENKFASNTLLPTQIPAAIGINTTAGNIFPIMPSIFRGTEPDQRVGSKITPVSLIIKGYLTLDLNDLDHDYDRVCIRLIAGFAKRYPSSVDALAEIQDHPNNNWTNKLVKLGSSDQAFDGTLGALQAPVNRAVFTVKAQKFISMSRPRFYDAALVGSDGFRESVHSTRFFTLKIKCPKTIKFDVDGNAAYPNNFAPVLCAGYALMNGSNPGYPSEVSPKPVMISYTTRFVYEDA